MTLEPSVPRSQGRGNTFVPAHALSQYEQGRALYKAGQPLRLCLTDEASRGWNDAADEDLRGAMAYLRAMEAEGIRFHLAEGVF